MAVATPQEQPSCWNCDFQQIGGNTFLGICTWFQKNGHGENKEIPPAIVDKGCQHFIVKNKIPATNGSNTP